MVGGDKLVDAQPTFQDNEPVVSFKFDSVGARRFGDATRENVGKPFAIVLDNKVISAPVIREPILGGSGIISGSFTVQSANDLALLLRAGALAGAAHHARGAHRRRRARRRFDPRRQATACIVGVGAGRHLHGAVLRPVRRVRRHRAVLQSVPDPGGLLSLLGATLTLPGIAGIVLTMGMAVDANVLIYERIREELRSGRTPGDRDRLGYAEAMRTIIDSHVTTMISSLLLFVFGTGTIKGFGLTALDRHRDLEQWRNSLSLGCALIASHWAGSI